MYVDGPFSIGRRKGAEFLKVLSELNPDEKRYARWYLYRLRLTWNNFSITWRHTLDTAVEIFLLPINAMFFCLKKKTVDMPSMCDRFVKKQQEKTGFLSQAWLIPKERRREIENILVDLHEQIEIYRTHQRYGGRSSEEIRALNQSNLYYADHLKQELERALG